MSKERIARNVLLLGTGQIATWLISTAAIVVSGRYLGTRGFGVLQTATAITALMGLVVALGMENYLVRSVARDPDRSAVVTTVALVLRVSFSLIVISLFTVFARIARVDEHLQLVTYVLAMTMMIATLSSALVATLQGRERMAPIAINSTVASLVDLILIVGLVKVHGDVVLFAAAGLPIAVVLLALNLRWFTQHVRFCWQITLRDIRDVVVGSLSFWLYSAFLAVYTWIDSVILAAIGGVSAVGIYSPAVRMFSVALFLPNILATVTLPVLSRLGMDPTARFELAGRKLIQLLIIVAVPITVGLATFAGPLMLTLYGSAFRPSIPVLAMLSLCIIPMFINMQIGSTLIASDRQGLWSLALGIGCVINPVLNVALIRLAIHRWDNAALGAAMALVVTELMQVLYGTYLLRGIIWRREVGVTLLATVIAGTAQLVMIKLTTFLLPPAQEVLGVLAFGLVALCCRVLPRHELQVLRETIASTVLHAFNNHVEPAQGVAE